MTRRQFYRELYWSVAFGAGSITVALIGRPQPFAIGVAAAGGITSAVIAVRAVEARAVELRRRRGRWDG